MAINSNEIIRCCARCEIVFIKEGQHPIRGGCPNCGFAHYGARYVYGKWNYLYIWWRLLTDPIRYRDRKEEAERNNDKYRKGNIK